MATSGRGTGVVGYNVQTAVDAEHHLIVAHDGDAHRPPRAQLRRGQEHDFEALVMSVDARDWKPLIS